MRNRTTRNSRHPSQTRKPPSPDPTWRKRLQTSNSQKTRNPLPTNHATNRTTRHHQTPTQPNRQSRRKPTQTPQTQPSRSRKHGTHHNCPKTRKSLRRRSRRPRTALRTSHPRSHRIQNMHNQRTQSRQKLPHSLSSIHHRQSDTRQGSRRPPRNIRRLRYRLPHRLKNHRIPQRLA